MPTKYQAIPGWFDWEKIYYDFAEHAPINARMVEMGVWFGRSLCYLAECCEHYNRGDIHLYGVDKWPLSDDELVKSLDTDDPDAVYKEVVANLSWAENITLIREPSILAVNHFSDHSLDLVFIDGMHRYNAVKQDILAWKDKVKPGGQLMGHDIVTWPGVKKAVREVFPNYRREGDVWMVTM